MAFDNSSALFPQVNIRKTAAGTWDLDLKTDEAFTTSVDADGLYTAQLTEVPAAANTDGSNAAPVMENSGGGGSYTLTTSSTPGVGEFYVDYDNGVVIVNSTDHTSQSGAFQMTYYGKGTVLKADEINAIVSSTTTLNSSIVTSSLTTVGALGSGSITSGFGAIDIGSDNLTATGTVSLGATSFNDNNITNVGNIALDSISSDAGTTVTVTLGTDAGDNFVVGNNSALVVEGDTDRVGIGTSTPVSLLHMSGGGGDGILSITRETVIGSANSIFSYYDTINSAGTSVGRFGHWSQSTDNSETYFRVYTHNGTTLTEQLKIDKDGVLTSNSGTWDSGGLDLASGDTYAINGTDVLSSTTLTLNSDVVVSRGAADVLMLASGDAFSTGGETAPDVDGGGICINHGANDGFALTIKNSDIAHGMTTLAETDTYAQFLKWDNNGGGLYIKGYTESTVGIILNGHATTEDTTDTSTSNGVIRMRCDLKSGTTSTSLGSTGVLFSIDNFAATRFLVKGNGDLHATNTTITALDTHDDIALARNLQLATTKRHKKMVSREDYNKLIELGALSSKGDFQIMQGVNSISLGAISQLFNALKGVANKIGISDNELLTMARNY